jgi:hypothetical protein
MRRIELEDRELDFIGTVLGAVPTIQTAQAGMLHLLPKLQAQANEQRPEAVPEPSGE